MTEMIICVYVTILYYLCMAILKKLNYCGTAYDYTSLFVCTYLLMTNSPVVRSTCCM